METLAMIVTDDTRQTEIKVDNSGASKDFTAEQELLNKKGSKSFYANVWPAEKAVNVNGVILKGQSLRVFIDFIKQAENL